MNINQQIEGIIENEKNVEEIHYMFVSMYRGIKKMVNKVEPFSPKTTILEPVGLIQ